MNPAIVTVHGINTEGDWQEDLKTVLEPHFECKSIKYPHYRNLGASKLFFDPWGALLIVVIMIARYFKVVTGYTFWLTFSFAILWSVLFPFVRRYLVRLSFEKQLGSFSLQGISPHIIAHSLGTYITGICLKKWPATRFEKIILVGCVLRRRYDWFGLLSEKPNAFAQVRNEVARRDWVARAAFLIQGLVPGLGHAGFSGFRERPKCAVNGLFHTLSSPNSACAQCAYARQVIVHNVLCRELGHSQCFTDLRYAQEFWLPFLWDIEPLEFQHWIRLCLGLNQLCYERDYTRLIKMELYFRDRYWNWAQGTIVDFTRRTLAAKLQFSAVRLFNSDAEDVVSLAVPKIWEAVSLALSVPLEDRQEKEKIVKMLYPRTAVGVVIDSLLEELGYAV